MIFYIFLIKYLVVYRKLVNSSIVPAIEISYRSVPHQKQSVNFSTIMRKANSKRDAAQIVPKMMECVCTLHWSQLFAVMLSNASCCKRPSFLVCNFIIVNRTLEIARFTIFCKFHVDKSNINVK